LKGDEQKMQKTSSYLFACCLIHDLALFIKVDEQGEKQNDND
jgi:hypothetical protein